MMATTELTTHFADNYGPYGFGVLAFIVILATLAVVWQKVFKPSLDTLLGISASFERTTMNISQAAERLERLEQRHKKEAV